jgi:UDP-N-acetylmuramoylalanine--D-glutamate ligase
VTWFDQHRPLPAMPVPGRHNVENAQAAAAVGRLAGLADEAIAAGVAAFPGIEHRLELVGEWGGVCWYNDSKATNPQAARVGLAAFAGRPVVLIAGGQGEGFEIAGWLDDVRRSTSAVVVMGSSAGLLAEALAGHRVERASMLEDAVERAARLARPGDVVLLSPGYKSYDMFSGFEERGRRFKSIVRSRHE